MKIQRSAPFASFSPYQFALMPPLTYYCQLVRLSSEILSWHIYSLGIDARLQSSLRCFLSSSDAVFNVWLRKRLLHQLITYFFFILLEVLTLGSCLMNCSSHVENYILRPVCFVLSFAFMMLTWPWLVTGLIKHEVEERKVMLY